MAKDKDDYKHYDSPCFIEYAGARVAMPVRCVPGKDDSAMVSFKMVADSRNQERFVEAWIEVNVSPFHAKAASFLEQGDILHLVRGRFAVRTWGDEGENTTICCERAEIVIPIELFQKLKERGFEPDGDFNFSEGDDKKSKKGKKDKKGGKKVEEKKTSKKPSKPVEIPEDDEDEEEDDDTEIEEDEDEE